MKNNKPLIITVICLIVLLIVAIITFLVMCIKGSFKFNFNNFNFGTEISKTLYLDKKYDNLFNEVKIDTNSADIEILNSENEKAKVVIYADEDKLKTKNINTTNDILNIELKTKECVGFCINKKSKVMIYLPETYDKEITIKNNYGDIDIDEFENSIINIEEDCGDVVIESAKKVDVDNNYGDVEIKNVVISEIKNDCGDVKIGTVNDITIENNMGDIKIEKVNEFLDISADCGDIKIDDINLIKNSNITNNLGDVKIKNIKDVYIDAKTDLGNVKINNNYNKSDITLKIENDCGDIKIEN